MTFSKYEWDFAAEDCGRIVSSIFLQGVRRIQLVLRACGGRLYTRQALRVFSRRTVEVPNPTYLGAQVLFLNDTSSREEVVHSLLGPLHLARGVKLVEFPELREDGAQSLKTSMVSTSPPTDMQGMFTMLQSYVTQYVNAKHCRLCAKVSTFLSCAE